MKSFNDWKNWKRFLILTAIVAAIALPVKARTTEKAEYVLAPPIFVHDPGGKLAYEVRGNVYPKGYAFDCEQGREDGRVGTYRFTILYGSPSEYQGQALVSLKDGRNLVWRFYYKIDPDEIGQTDFSWPYEGNILNQETEILTDFTPLSRKCFGGKLVVYFLN